MGGNGWNGVNGTSRCFCRHPKRAQPPLTRAVSQHYIKAQPPTPAPSLDFWDFCLGLGIRSKLYASLPLSPTNLGSFRVRSRIHLSSGSSSSFFFFSFFFFCFIGTENLKELKKRGRNQTKQYHQVLSQFHTWAYLIRKLVSCSPSGSRSTTLIQDHCTR
jgi:hypothetical protein